MTPTWKSTLRTFLPTQLKTHAIRGGPLRGRQIFTSWHDYPGAIRGTTESDLLAWFARNVKSGETWLDVGAHYGYTALALTELVGRTGRVFAFEPVISTAGCLSRTREINSLTQLIVVPLALSACSRGLHTHRLPTIRGMADSTLQQQAWNEGILMAQFDWIWETLSNGREAIDGAKIDVQGMEESTLRGMENMIKRWQPKLVIEFHAGVNRESILEFLADCGYKSPCESVEQDTGYLEDNRSYAFYASSKAPVWKSDLHS
jgi:FkbM family methyltransferase